jgi:DNA gyrase subunit A
MGRTATGVRGIRLREGGSVVSLIIPKGDGAVLTVTENGYGKRTALTEYPAKSRATQGVLSIKVSERNGLVVGAVQVCESDEIMMISNRGTLVRTRVKEVSEVGRNTQGVILIRTQEQEKVVGVAKVDEIQEQDLPQHIEEGTDNITVSAVNVESADVAGPDLQDSQLAQDKDTEQ